MSEAWIEKLTPEQEALIPVYREKWRAIALSTEPIDRQKATVAVKAVYAALGQQEPRIIFCSSPYAGLWEGLHLKRSHYLGRQMWGQLWQQIWKQLNQKVVTQLEALLAQQLLRQLEEVLERQAEQWQLEEQLQLGRRKLPYVLDNCINPELWVNSGSMFDVCISVLNCKHDRRAWAAFQAMGQSCSWIYPFEKTCIVCDRPTQLSIDSEQRLHAEAEPAIQFADGYTLYAYHGVILPEKYGKLHPSQWQAQFLLEERNTGVRRVLIQEIGYARIFHELQAQQLDTWAEYTLLKINGADIEPMYLLKMTCPSTGFIHVLRVPPNMKSAREAIRWVNWGTAPEEFLVQT